MDFKSFNEWGRPRYSSFIHILFLMLFYSLNANTIRNEDILNKSTNDELFSREIIKTEKNVKSKGSLIILNKKVLLDERQAFFKLLKIKNNQAAKSNFYQRNPNTFSKDLPLVMVSKASWELYVKFKSIF